jgi:hypothetical protein
MLHISLSIGQDRVGREIAKASRAVVGDGQYEVSLHY